MTYSSPSLTARVLMPATSEPASGSVIPRQAIFSPLIDGHEVVLLLLLGAEQVDRRRRHVRVHRDAHAQAAAVRVRPSPRRARARSSSRRPGRRTPRGRSRPEEPELAHAREHPVLEGRLLPLLRVRPELLDDEVVDRLAELLVLVGEDEVPAGAGVIGLQDISGGHARTVPCRPMAFDTIRYEVADGVATVTLDQPDTRNALSDQLLDELIAAFVAARDDGGVRCVVLTSSHEKVFSSGANLGGFAAEQPLVLKHFGTERFPRLFRLIGELGKPTICAANGHVLAGRAGDRAGLRPDRRPRGRAVRDARDQRRRVPVHDHGADLPQRRRARRPTSCCCWASRSRPRRR